MRSDFVTFSCNTQSIPAKNCHHQNSYFLEICSRRIVRCCLNTYTHLGLENAAEELHRMEEAEDARREQEKIAGKTPPSQKMFKAV